MQPHSEKENAKDAVVTLTVTIPPANSVEIVNPTLKPSSAICNWCRNSRADIWCDTLPICLTCLELMIERENAIAINKKVVTMPLPAEWEK